MIYDMLFIMLKNFVFFTWCLPQTLLGLTIQAFFKIKSRTKYKLATVVELDCNFGVSLGKYILIGSGRKTEKTVMHEYGHTIQSFILGPLYLLAVGMPSVIRNIVTRFVEIDYYSGYPENWADKLGGVKR
jgi:hypothetical protein